MCQMPHIELLVPWCLKCSACYRGGLGKFTKHFLNSSPIAQRSLPVTPTLRYHVVTAEQSGSNGFASA